MHKLLLHIILLSSIPFLLFAQKPKVKYETVIINTIDNKGISTIDTSTMNEYDNLGRMIFSHNPSQHGDCSASIYKYLEEKITIDSNANHLHQVLIYNDSSRKEMYCHYYKDSVVTFYVYDYNNNNKVILYIKRNKTIRYSRYLLENYDVSFDKYVIKDNFLFSKTIEVAKDMEGNIDSALHKIFRILNLLKVYSFNVNENKWCLESKVRKNKKDQLVKETKIEYKEKTKTKFKYNKSDQKIQEIIKTPTHKIKKKYIYIYEYY